MVFVANLEHPTVDFPPGARESMGMLDDTYFTQINWDLSVSCCVLMVCDCELLCCARLCAVVLSWRGALCHVACAVYFWMRVLTPRSRRIRLVSSSTCSLLKLTLGILAPVKCTQW